MIKSNSSLLFLLCIVLTTNSVAQVFPGEDWEFIQHTDFYGWQSDALAEVNEYVVDSTLTTGMMVIHEGKVVYRYGNITENSYIASCRKSILAMLYGKHVKNGTINLDATLEDLGIDEQESLTDIEKTATIRDLISARSGIFLPASNPGDMQHLSPGRGSKKPGEYWLYNNWDFNMAGHIFETLTQKNIYDEIESQFALPLNMQDWDRSIQAKSGDYTASDIMAYHIWFSARDMARLGLMLLNKGQWDGQQVMNEAWVQEMTTPKSTFEELDQVAPFLNDDGTNYSYGYMWWLWDTPEDDLMHGAYSAQGAWGQNITVIPKTNTVVIIKTNELYERQLGNHHTLIRDVVKSYDPARAKAFESLTSSLNEDNIAQFVLDFKQLKPNSDLLDFEDKLNSMGYYYMEHAAYEKALELFKLNVELNPQAWNVYDSLGEAYFMLGNYPKALEAYQKTVKLNVQNLGNNNERVEFIRNRIKRKMKAN